MLFKFVGDTRKRLLRNTIVCEVADDAVDSIKFGKHLTEQLLIITG